MHGARGQGCTHTPERVSYLAGTRADWPGWVGSSFSLMSFGRASGTHEDMKRHHSWRLRWNLLFYSGTNHLPHLFLGLKDTQSFLVSLTRGSGQKDRLFSTVCSQHKKTQWFFFFNDFNISEVPRLHCDKQVIAFLDSSMNLQHFYYKKWL